MPKYSNTCFAYNFWILVLALGEFVRNVNISFGYVLFTLIGHGVCGGVRWECALKIRTHEHAPSPQLGHDLSTVNLLWFIIAFVTLNFITPYQLTV